MISVHQNLLSSPGLHVILRRISPLIHCDGDEIMPCQKLMSDKLLQGICSHFLMCACIDFHEHFALLDGHLGLIFLCTNFQVVCVFGILSVINKLTSLPKLPDNSPGAIISQSEGKRTAIALHAFWLENMVH